MLMSAFRPKVDIAMLFVGAHRRKAAVLALFLWSFGSSSFAAAQTLPGPATDTPRDGLMNREQGLARAREVAKSSGRDLARYELNTFGDELTEDRSEWVFIFQCKPIPPPPGCHFMVVVDRRTGDARLFPGM